MGSSKVQIDIVVGGEVYGCRNWTHVPRVGECIKLTGKKAGWYLINKVDWHGTDYPIVTINVSKQADS